MRLICMLTFAVLSISTSTNGGAPGCALEKTSAITESGEFKIVYQDITRKVFVHLPPGYDASKPSKVVYMFHGWCDDPMQVWTAPEVVSALSTHNFIGIGPAGLGEGDGGSPNSCSSWTAFGTATGVGGDGKPTCDMKQQESNLYASCAGLPSVTFPNCSWSQCQQSDVKFTEALNKWVQERLCIDTQNIFALGTSNGGMFTWTLAQSHETASIFRGYTAIVGIPMRGYLDGPGKNSGDAPFLLITSTNDPTCPPGDYGNTSFTETTDGDSYYYTGATSIIKSWSKSQGCDVNGPARKVEPFPNLDLAFYPQNVNCRSFCGGEVPKVIDCRGIMGHAYHFEFTMPMALSFFNNASTLGIEKNSTSNHTTLILAITIPVACVLLGIILYSLYRKKKKKKALNGASKQGVKRPPSTLTPGLNFKS
eukprot:CAMPEP_0203744204 /NCGR_PEP_ID=MMETSP0098-20131031/359_1 /ASSEMBLY_ACC=CAM_ASM_000208 /TAXON_ID=96639 /ORGANISM=" , Strain NY0313808BC1" /LENGTH=422 /DNA_ID=CAMNT_0050631665 /DNA_START=493 /DNA_END=1761 /DNA_ORIENTATION=-